MSEVRLVAFDGGYWTSGPFSHEYWQTDLGEFSSVILVCRCRYTDSEPQGHRRVDGDSVSVESLAHYHGIREFLRVAPRLIAQLSRSASQTGALLLMLPGVLGTIAGFSALLRRRPYSVQLVGDPREVFGAGQVGGRAGPVLRFIFHRATRVLVGHADHVAYVTSQSLQAAYPTKSTSTTHSFSNVQLPEHAAYAAVRNPDSVLRLVTVASLEQPYKGVDDLLRAVRLLVDRGHAVRVDIIGDGQLRGKLSELAASLELSERARFVGSLPSPEAVMRSLAQYDLFILPSRTEGLPRALIEAMAVGLPCIGSNVGGIPELLPPGCLFLPDHPEHIAEMVESLISDEGLRRQLGVDNLQRAREYSPARMTSARHAFMAALRTSIES